MLQSMYHAPTITARRAKILGAVDQILSSLSQHLPTLLQLFALSGRSVTHVHAVQVRKQLPQEVFENICNYLVVDATAAIDHLLRVKAKGYCLGRHPAVQTDTPLEEPELAIIYRNVVLLHKKKLCELRRVLGLMAGLCRCVGWDTYRNSVLRALDIAISIHISPELQRGKSVAHEHFCPREEP